MDNENRLNEFRKIAISLASHEKPARVANASGLIDFRRPGSSSGRTPPLAVGNLRSNRSPGAIEPTGSETTAAVSEPIAKTYNIGS